jgi:hypothetical protein
MLEVVLLGDSPGSEHLPSEWRRKRRYSAQRYYHSRRRSRLGRSRLLRQQVSQDAEPRSPRRFGGRAKENGSRGTDHGSAAPMLLIGGKVKAGPVGEHPSLTKLAFGNLQHHTDFRQVYAAILDKWLGVSSKDVLGEEFKHVEIFKS